MTLQKTKLIELAKKCEIPSEYGIKLVAEISAWINKNERNKL